MFLEIFGGESTGKVELLNEMKGGRMALHGGVSKPKRQAKSEQQADFQELAGKSMLNPSTKAGENNNGVERSKKRKRDHSTSSSSSHENPTSLSNSNLKTRPDSVSKTKNQPNAQQPTILPSSSHRKEKKSKKSVTASTATSSARQESLTASNPPTELEKINSLLGQIWHRNKNQHRVQKWWKWLGMLRKGVRRLVELEVEGGDGLLGNSDAGKLGGGGGGGAEGMRRALERRREREMERERWEEWIREGLMGGGWL